MKLTTSSSPHIVSARTIPLIMIDVVIALMPAFVASVIFFGINALRVVLTSVGCCVLFEYLTVKYLLKAKNTTHNFSAVITGLLLAFNLPANVATSMIIIGAFMAILVAKMAFGGLGKNFFNPALVGSTFLFVSFPVAMGSWQMPMPFDFLSVDAVAEATPLAILKDASDYYALPFFNDMLLGNRAGCLGETSVLALLLGFVYLICKKVISWHVPVCFVGSAFVFCFVAYTFGDNEMYNPIIQIMSGGLLLGAIFMATDYTTTPMTKKGKVVFAVCGGILTCIIRFYGSYPEGVGFAILIMNAFVPIINKCCHNKFFGAKK